MNGQCYGVGLLKYPKTFEYEGHFDEDGPNGISRLKLGNGDVYNGMFRKGKIHGYGMMDNKKKKETYEGYWMRNSMM